MLKCVCVCFIASSSPCRMTFNYDPGAFSVLKVQEDDKTSAGGGTDSLLQHYRVLCVRMYMCVCMRVF